MHVDPSLRREQASVFERLDERRGLAVPVELRGDVDGVVIVPKDLTLEILTAAEGVYERERGMREELRRGVSIKDAYAKYGAF